MPWPRGRGRGESRTSPRRIRAVERATEALRLRAAGRTYEAIATALGYRDASGAWRAVDRTLAAGLAGPRPPVTTPERCAAALERMGGPSPRVGETGGCMARQNSADPGPGVEGSGGGIPADPGQKGRGAGNPSRPAFEFPGFQGGNQTTPPGSWVS